jgi:hypothetical protein
MIIKCVKLECELCGNLASIQIFYNKSGIVKYARARHYLSMLNRKPQFEYHQQSLDYIERKLGELPIIRAENGHIGQLNNNVDLQKTESGLEQRNWSWGWAFKLRSHR